MEAFNTAVLTLRSPGQTVVKYHDTLSKKLSE